MQVFPDVIQHVYLDISVIQYSSGSQTFHDRHPLSEKNCPHPHCANIETLTYFLQVNFY